MSQVSETQSADPTRPYHSAYRRDSNYFVDLLRFRRMITPVIIQVVFWIGIAMCVVGGLITTIAALKSPYGPAEGVLAGLGMMLLGPLVVRIYCELLMVIFMIQSSLSDMRNFMQSDRP